MGKIKAHEIVFEGSHTFDAGSDVKGHVFVQLEGSLRARGISLLFRGKAKTACSTKESRYDFNKNRDVEYRVTKKSTRSHLNVFLQLHGIGPDQGNATIEMPPGDHTFPFAFTLPGDLPAPFRGKYGSVEYHVKSKIDLPWKLDSTVKQPFYIRPVADLNSDPSNKYGLSGEKDKTVGCLCCESGPISATVKIMQQGFVPGEAIRIFAEINNDSDRSISKSYVNLERTASFYALGVVKSQTMEIARVSRPGFGPHGRDEWRGQPLIVPPTPPSGFPGCDIIDVKYKLKLNVVPTGLSYSLDIPLDIKIGTIPLRQEEEGRPDQADPNLVNGTAPDFYTTAALPSYQEYGTGGDNPGYLHPV